MSFQFLNDPGTTLAAAITSTGATTITVSSSTGYGSGTVDFIIAIDLELMGVTNISGTTWTVTRGIESTTAATHPNGTPVNAVQTAGSISALAGGGGSNLFGALSALPSPTVGARYTTSDSIYEFIGVTGPAWQALYKGKAVTLPPSSGWTWDNQGGSTASAPLGALAIVMAPSASELRMYYRAAPTPPYTITARFRAFSWSGVGATSPFGYGVGFRDSAGKIIAFELITASTARGFELDKFTNSGSSATAYTALNNNLIDIGVSQIVGFPEIYMQIEDDGTNLTWRWSIDEITWFQYDQRSRTDFFASGPTEWGITGFIGGQGEGVTLTLIDATIS